MLSRLLAHVNRALRRLRLKNLPLVEEVTNDDSEDSDSRGGRNRRRRRGGRGRRKPQGDELTTNEDSQEGDDSTEGVLEDGAEGGTHRRRRRRRASGDGVTPGEVIDEDGVVTVVKVREVREKSERPARERTERGTRNRRDRDRGRSDSREYREPYRRRGTVITDGEFLARRENVDREMVVRQIGDRIQIAVIEDNVMVEHYVNRNANVSYVGNVYLGRVQNVLPSMEAAFVDIGKGRNAVLYAGEVNWDAAGISESEPRKIEMVLENWSTSSSAGNKRSDRPEGCTPNKPDLTCQDVMLSMFLVGE
jgi:ribonuclease E